MPRLELTAAAMAAKMDSMLKSELDMELQESVFWSDSTTVLKYLNNESTRFPTFVANRVTLIRELSNISQWRYVNTSLNPADSASRSLQMLFLNRRCGCQVHLFLAEPNLEWPEIPVKLRC